MADAPLTRKRLLVVTTVVGENGQYEPLEIRLPDSALRLTGISAIATPLPGQSYERRDAFVIFGPAPAGATQVASAEIPVPGTNRVTEVYQILNGPDSVLLAHSLSAYDPTRHVGFYQALTDEVPLQRLEVPANMVVFYAHTVSLGIPVLVDADGQPLTLVRENVFEEVKTPFTEFVHGTATLIHSTLAYLCRVDPPPPRNTWLFGIQEKGYWNGILFPGTPDAY